MANELRAATIRPSLAIVAADRGPPIPHYAVPLDQGTLYRFAVGDASTPDGLVVVAPSGGTAGNWILVRQPDQGAALGDADATITVGGNRWRTIPVGTLTANRTLTLSTTNALPGDWIELTRLDVSAHTVAVVNGGVGGGTLWTKPSGVRSWGRAYFDGTNWLHRASSLML